uniref:Peptidase A1 domain-containing protein n=1 Tax=Brassica campestris TaxID=3711 RepID=M4CDD1_BRACM
MGGLTHLIVFVSMCAAITLISEAQYLIPVTKDEPTKQFYTTVNIGAGGMSSPVNLLLDLGTNLTWLNCRKIRLLSSLRAWPRPTGRVVQDNTTIFTTQSGKPISIAPSRRFTFSCAVEKYRQGMAPRIAGVVALSPGEFPFWRQIASAYNIIPKFALCLPSYGRGLGYFYIGTHSFGGSNPVPMTLTPLKIDSGKYLVSVTSIYVDGVSLTLDPSLLEGGAQLSTVVPYTVLQTDIYNALAQSFTLKAKKIGMSETTGHAPFKHCFEEGASGKNMDVSVMEIGLPGNGREVKWRFQGANMVVRVSETVICLAFVDGGKKPNESMVVGTHQLENYLIEFDLSTTRMAFSDPLVLHNISCAK